MKFFKALSFAAISMLGASIAWSSQQTTPDADVGVSFVKERASSEVCPPDSEATRTLIQRYLNGQIVRVIQPDELALAFDLPRLTLDDFEPLTDRNDVEVCQRLNEHFGHLLDLAINVPTPEGVETRHHYEITYFRARHHGMYIAAIDAPVVSWRDEQTRTRGLVRPPGLGTTILFFDFDVEQVYRRHVQEEVSRQKDLQAGNQ